MELRESDRLGARLFAIHLRLAELNRELQETQMRVHLLESQLQDAQLAQLMGENAGDPAIIAPELERSRGRLESQRELIERVKRSQWKARVAYTLQRVKERRAERERESAG